MPKITRKDDLFRCFVPQFCGMKPPKQNNQMRRNVLVFGFISGLIVTIMMIWGSMSFYNSTDFKGNAIIGYASMILAFAFVFVGIKNFRDRYNGGVIPFGKAFRIGLYISLIASTCYVVTWLIEYYFFIPDFMDKYSAHMIKEAHNSGVTGKELQDKLDSAATMKKMYRNPLFVILMTYAEILPIGLIVALISALILKRGQKKNPDTFVTGTVHN